MKLLSRKMHVFCVSNIMTSFALTSFLGINYSLVPENEVSNNSEVAILDTDVDPLSQVGEKAQNEVAEVSKETKTTVKTTNTTTTVKTTKKTTTKVATVSKQEVKASKTYVPASYSAVTGQAVVDYAMKYLGLRYVSGGYSLSTGTDCSGFTKLIYKEFGVTLSRAVKSQAKNGTYVSKANLQKGDLVFYGYGNGVVRHVGIYIGNGQVLHESNPRDGVKINSVNMMQYITARRVINSTAIKMVEEKIEAEKTQELANTEKQEETPLSTDNKEVDVTKEVKTNEVDNPSSSLTESSVKEEIVSQDNNKEMVSDVKTIPEATETKETVKEESIDKQNVLESENTTKEENKQEVVVPETSKSSEVKEIKPEETLTNENQ